MAKNESSSKREIMQNERISRALERIANKMEARFACNIDIPLNIHNVVQYGAYYGGVLMALNFVREEFLPSMKGDDKVYMEASLNLATESKDNARRFIERAHEVRYRNWVRDKKGKLVKCEAFFAKKVVRYEEVE